MIDIKYDLIRSSRRTLGVCVRNDGRVIVRAPYRTPVKEIEKFVEGKADWIERHRQKFFANNSLYSDVLNFSAVLVAGRKVDLKICSENKFGDDGVFVTDIKKLKNVFVKNLGADFLSVFNAFGARFNVSAAQVKFKDYKSRWGCCNRSGQITFNYKLLMLPKDLWELVAAHELCHTVHMDHSAKFYSLLQSLIPDAKERRVKLKNYSFICSLY